MKRSLLAICVIPLTCFIAAAIISSCHETVSPKRQTEVSYGKVETSPHITAKRLINITTGELMTVLRGNKQAWNTFSQTATVPNSVLQRIALAKETAELHGDKADMKTIDLSIGGEQHISCTGNKSCDLKCGSVGWIRITEIPDNCSCYNPPDGSLIIDCRDPCRSFSLQCSF